MPNYATTAELKARFENDATVAHLLGDQDSSSIDDALLQTYVDAAEQLIDSRLGVRYQTPIDVTVAGQAALMKNQTLDIAAFKLASGRGVVPETLEKAHDAVIAWAEAVRDGTAVLTSQIVEPATLAQAPRASFGRATDPPNRAFTRATQSAV